MIRGLLHLPSLLSALLALTSTAHAQPAAAPAAAVAPAAAQDTVDESTVTTSDGWTIPLWCYRIPDDATPQGIVILLHDLGGSHASVEPLAKALQAAKCIVVAPDLRGHGDSEPPGKPGDKKRDDAFKSLKKPDFDMMAASRGGSVRDQSGIRGDVECVRNWIVSQQKRDQDRSLPRAPLFVVGSGLGAIVAAHWVSADAAWPDIASGPQGREVAGLVMISPEIVTKGFAIAPALTRSALPYDDKKPGNNMPVVFIAGADDRDARTLFKQTKVSRKDDWHDSRDRDGSPRKPGEASLILIDHPAGKSGDQLATTKSPDQKARLIDPMALIPGFIQMAAGRVRR
jgi:dienelactone hydrolase